VCTVYRTMYDTTLYWPVDADPGRCHPNRRDEAGRGSIRDEGGAAREVPPNSVRGRCHPIRRLALFGCRRGYGSPVLKYRKCPPTPSQTQAALGRRRFGNDFRLLRVMSRRFRFIPEGGALVEVTCRALHSRLLFRSSPELNQIIIGTLTRARQRHEVRVCFFVGISTICISCYWWRMHEGSPSSWLRIG
jgi:hypothetical protein